MEPNLKSEEVEEKVIDINAEKPVEEEEAELDEFGNPVDDEENEDDAEKKDDKKASEDDKLDEKKDGEADAEDKDEDEVDPVEALKKEVGSLRSMVRSQRRLTKTLEEQLEKQNAALVDKDIVAEDELSDEGAEAVAARNKTLENLVEVMELNPKFEDVKDVCSQSNVDDVVEMLARSYVEEHGGDIDEIADGIIASIWAKPNPYKEIYGLVKEFHPDYVVIKEKVKVKDVEEEEEKTSKKAAPSLSGIKAGGGKGGVGWTADRIDKMSEAELGTVPADIYEKYMQGELD